MTLQDPPAAPAPAARPARPARPPLRRAYDVLVSPALAIAILVTVLACCLVGVTVFRGQRSNEVIFGTLWFNGLLVLLATSSAAAFFTRTWKRKLTLVSAGLILFHLSFLALLGGVVFRSLFQFQGVMRLTEGETLPNGARESYDAVSKGRFFDYARLRGQTTLVKMHRDYKVGRDNKRAAYEVTVADGAQTRTQIVYITEYLDFLGLRYFRAKEGYTVLVVATDREGQELYGAFVPLQSIRQEGGGHMYATGTAVEPRPFPFPPPPDEPRAELLVTYWPDLEGRSGQVTFQVEPVYLNGIRGDERKGMVKVGEPFDAGDFLLTAREIRYWVGMDVRYDPGWWVIMSSLGFGLLGMVLTLAGRLRQGARSRLA